MRVASQSPISPPNIIMMLTANKGGGGNEQQPNKDDKGKDKESGRPPLRPKLPGTRAQYALYLNGRYVRIQQLDAAGMKWTSEVFADQDLALAWFEEKTPNVHHFLFHLGNYYYLLFYF